jgi:predicted DCC family thiol-disulfide oxidoreductase YuxK
MRTTNALDARDVHERLILIDCSDPHFDATPLPYSRDSMMTLITAQDASGRWLRGVDVFIAVYEAAELNIVSKTLANPNVKSIATRAYPWIVRNRYLLSTLGVQHVMNFFAARVRKKVNKQRAKEALAKSQSCVTTTCVVEPTQQ